MKRPLAAVALLEVCGILFALLPVSLVVPFILFLAAAGIFLFLPRVRLPAVCAMVLLAGWANLSWRQAVLSPFDLRRTVGTNQISGTLQGVLLETPRHTLHKRPRTGETYWTSTALIAVSELTPDGERVSRRVFGRVATTTTGYLPETIFTGQTVIVGGVLQPARGPLAEGLFDYRAYLSHEGAYYEMRVADPADWRPPNPPGTPPLADRFQAWARNALALGLPVKDEALELEWALTLGWKAALTDQVSEPFIRSATYHIFAVDGLRIAIVAGILIGLFRAVGVPRAVCGIAAAPFLIFYAGMTGWPASAVRALVMAFVIFGGWAMKRPSDLLNSLFAAVVIILTWEPRELFQAGFQLSFLVVLCIIVIMPFFERVRDRLLQHDPLLPEHLRPRWRRILDTPARWTLGLFLASVAAWLGSIPLVAYYFHIFTPISGPANVVAIPLCAGVLICNLSSLLFAAWLPSVAILFNHSGWFLMTCILKTSQWSANWPRAYAYVAMPGLFTIALYYGLLLACLTGWIFRQPGRKWKIRVAIVLCAVWCGNWLWSLPETRLTVLPLDGGHGIYLQPAAWGRDVLIDSGGENAVDAIVKPYLRAQGVNSLGQFVLTHGEADYSGGAGMLTELFRPLKIATSAVQFRSAEYRDFVAGLATNGASHTILRPGDRLALLTALYPDSGGGASRAEDEALVFRADVHGLRVLLLSDLGHTGQNNLLNGAYLAGKTNDLRADIVVSGVPAEGEPLGDALLDAVQPRLIIVADSGYGAQRKAGKALRERLARRNVPVIYTSLSDAVTLTIGPHHWQAKAMDGTTVTGVIPNSVK